jgi:hypothetical protein
MFLEGKVQHVPHPYVLRTFASLRPNSFFSWKLRSVPMPMHKTAAQSPEHPDVGPRCRGHFWREKGGGTCCTLHPYVLQMFASLQPDSFFFWKPRSLLMPVHKTVARSMKHPDMGPRCRGCFWREKGGKTLCVPHPYVLRTFASQQPNSFFSQKPRSVPMPVHKVAAQSPEVGPRC